MKNTTNIYSKSVKQWNPSDRPQTVCGRISAADTGSRSSAPANQIIIRCVDMPSELKYENQKVSQNRLSALMIFILRSADGGTERGEIAEGF